jgi:hypothetical protein
LAVNVKRKCWTHNRECKYHYSENLHRSRVAELTAICDQYRIDAERAAEVVESAGPTLTPNALARFRSVGWQTDAE